MADEDLFAKYGLTNPAAPEPAAPTKEEGDALLSKHGLEKPVRGPISEIANQGYAGTVVDLPKMAGQALQYASNPGNIIYDYGKSVADAATARGKRFDLQPDEDNHNFVTNALAGGARMIPQSVVPPLIVGAGLAALPFSLPAMGSLAAASAVGSLPTAMSQGQETLDKARAKGIPEDQAIAAARANALIEGGGETLGTIMGGKLFGIGANTISKLAQSSAAKALENQTSTSILKPFVKQLGETAAAEVGTEMGQNAGEAAVEQHYGIDDKSPWQAAKEAIAPTLGMTALLAPFGMVGFAKHAHGNRVRTNALASSDTPAEDRGALADQFAGEIAKVDANAANVFRANAQSAIEGKRPLTVDESLFTAPAPPAEPLPGTQAGDIGNNTSPGEPGSAMAPDTAPVAGQVSPEQEEQSAAPSTVMGGQVPENQPSATANLPAPTPTAGPLSQAAQAGGLDVTGEIRQLPLTEKGAQTRADYLNARGTPHEVVEHPTLAGRFAVQPIEAAAEAGKEVSAQPLSVDESPKGVQASQDQQLPAALAQPGAQPSVQDAGKPANVPQNNQDVANPIPEKQLGKADVTPANPIGQPVPGSSAMGEKKLGENIPPNKAAIVASNLAPSLPSEKISPQSPNVQIPNKDWQGNPWDGKPFIEGEKVDSQVLPGDVGAGIKAGQSRPFQSRGAAIGKMLRNNLDTHEIVQVGKEAFVLRPKTEIPEVPPPAKVPPSAKATPPESQVAVTPPEAAVRPEDSNHPVNVSVIEAETGRQATVQMPAKDALKHYDDRIELIKAIRECLSV